MEHEDKVKVVAQRIQGYFSDQDRADEYRYLPWDRLNETQKSFWLEAAFFALNGDTQ